MIFSLRFAGADAQSVEPWRMAPPALTGDGAGKRHFQPAAVHEAASIFFVQNFF
jgi:hypothetical protein